MTSSVTRSRSLKKTTKLEKTQKTIKKKKQGRTMKKEIDIEKEEVELYESKEESDSIMNEKMDASEHPEYKKLLNQLDQSKLERLEKIENWRNLEYQAIHDWFNAQKKQAWDDFHYAKMKLRSNLVKDVQNKITRLKQELSLLNKQLKVQYSKDQQDYEDWVPPDRLYAIGSFVGGATTEEIDRDFMYAKQPYNGTPNLVYSDYESKSTTDTAEENESPTTNEIISNTSTHDSSFNSTYQPPSYHYQQQQPQQLNSGYHHHPHSSYPPPPPPPPYSYEETTQTGRDWWPYRSTTTA